MMTYDKMTPEEYKSRSDRSAKLILGFAMVSMTMMFAGLTSAFVVSKSRGDWMKNFEMPSAFYISTVVLLFCSVTFHIAKVAIKRDNRNLVTAMLLSTLALSAIFVFFQFKGFGEIVAAGHYFTGSASNITTTFLYVVTCA